MINLPPDDLTPACAFPPLQKRERLKRPAALPEFERHRGPDDAAFFDSLRELKRNLPNRNEAAGAAIQACIEYGINTGPRIVGALHQIGFDKRFAGIILSKGTGDNPKRYYWQRVDNVYRPHSDAPYALRASPAARITVPPLASEGPALT